MAPTAIVVKEVASPRGTPEDNSCHKKLYGEDVVYKFNKRKMITLGTVHDPEDTDDDSTDSDESSKPKPLTPGQVVVTWDKSMKKLICEKKKVHLMSRNICIDNCVTRLKNGRETQKGVCTRSDQEATVQLVGSKKVVEHVYRCRLRDISTYKVDDAVTLGDRFGRITDVDRLLKMRASCGATVEILTCLNRDEITDAWNESLNDSEFPYYTGQEVVCTPKMLNDGKWVGKSKFTKSQLKKDQKFTIESVSITNIEVRWQDPDELGHVAGDDIGKLSVSAWTHNLAIGDRFVMRLQPYDVLRDKSDWRKSPAFLANETATAARDESVRSNSGDGGERNESNDNVTVEVLCADCRVSVLWQDGTEEHDIPSTELHYLSDAVDAHEFFPGDWVIHNHQDDGEKRGVVQKVNFAERIAEVKWYIFISKMNVGSAVDDICTSEHSVYDLKRDDEFKFELGSDVVKWMHSGALLGKVIALSRQGYLIVHWLDDTVENCWPFDDIKLVEEAEDDDDDFCDKGSVESWETATSVSDDVPSFEGSKRNSVKSTTLEKEEEEEEEEGAAEECDDSVKLDAMAELSDATKLEAFLVIDEAPTTHQYYFNAFEPTSMRRFSKALQREHKLFRESLPNGVWVRAYEDRTDLLSVMIRGAKHTPYEDGLFLFDIQLSADYPKNPPQVYFRSYIDERLNPNLYVEGVVCVSLLGTWEGEGSEVWGPSSTLLQLIVSIQGLILVAEPHYNEAGHEKQEHTQQGYENSRTYNELVILKLVQSTTVLLQNCPEVFRSEVTSHFRNNGEKMCRRIESYCTDDPFKPDFPLLPVSKGLKLSLAVALQKFRETLTKTC